MFISWLQANLLVDNIMQAILILDVPSVDHIPSLIASFTSSDFYLRFWSQDPTVSGHKESDAVLRVAYHMCGEGVLEDQRYKAFMRGFGSVVHVSIS